MADRHLCDPTREELHNGFKHSTLPDKVKDLARRDTVCRFCGVSYLVFSEIKALDEKFKDSNYNLQCANDEIDTLKLSIATEKARNSRANKNNNNQASEHADSNNNNNNNNNADTDADADNRRRQDMHIEELESTNATMRTELDRLRQSSERAIEDTHTQTKSLTSANQELVSVVKRMRNDHRALQTKLASTERSLHEQKEKARIRTEEIKETTSAELETLRATNARLEAQVNHTRHIVSKIQNTTRQSGAPESVSNECKNSLTEFRASFLAYSDTIVSRITAKETWTRSTIQVLKAQLERTQIEARGENSTLERQVSLANERTNESHAETKRQSKRAKALQSNIDTLSEEIQSQRMALEKERFRANQATNKLQQLEAAQNEIVLNKNSQELFDLQTQISLKTKECEAHCATILKLERCLADEQLKANYAKKLEHAQETVKTLQSQIHVYETKMQQGKDALFDIMNQSKRRETKAQHTQEQLVAALNELELLRIEHTQWLAHADASTELETANAQVAALSGRCQQLESSAKTNANTRKAVEESLVRSRASLNAVTAQVKKLEGQMRGLENDRHFLKCENIDLNERLDAQNAEFATQRTSLNRFKRQAMEAAEQLEEYEHLISNKEKQINALLKSTKSLETRVNDAEKSAEENAKVLEDTKTNLSTTASSVNNSVCKSIQTDVVDNNSIRNAAAAAKAAEEEEGMMVGIEVMERHLIKLSEVIRNKETEIKALRYTIHTECAERTRLQDELETLKHDMR